MNNRKTLTTGKVWCFAIGQFGWSVLAALISSWLAPFYQPDGAATTAGMPLLIPQGRVVLGLVTVLGMIMAIGRVFDAITDPLIASKSDRCKSPSGRRIPFMRAAAIPFALTCVLTFWSPVKGAGWGNVAFLFVMQMLFYLFMTMYCTPYNALIPELGADQKTRMNISTAISFTYIAGMAVAYMVPVIQGFLQNYMSYIAAFRTTVTAIAVVGMACMFVPVFTIREKDYIDVVPSESTAFKSLAATFRNKDFRVFVASDIAYFLGLTMFQTALPYFVTTLLGLDKGMSQMYFVLMTALSMIFYIPINKLTPKLGKRKLILCAFVIFTISFAYTALFGKGLPIPPTLQGYILCVVAAPAMAIFGILPQAVVADIAECDQLETHENRSGMFYAARTFAFKMGQSIALLLSTALFTIGQTVTTEEVDGVMQQVVHSDGTGYRIVAVAAALVCMLGGLLFMKYDEKKVYSKILK